MDKQKDIEEFRKKLNKDVGDSTVVNLNDKPMQIESISTGSLNLDIALGIGGLPKGRIVEIYGPESSGKTTIAIHTIAEAQKKGGYCAIIDAEHAFDASYATSLGVDLNMLDFCQPSSGDQGLDVARRMIESGLYDVVVIDSVAALVPEAELEGDIGDSRMGLHARLMSQALRMITGIVSKSNTLVIFINQLREKIGVMFGNPETTTGGNSLKFYASVRLSVTRSLSGANKVTDGDVITGNKTTVKVIKNKVSPPFRTAEFDILYGKGIDKLSEIIDVAVSLELIKKGGAGWFSFEEQKIQGKDNVKQFLIDNEEYTNHLLETIKSKLDV